MFETNSIIRASAGTGKTFALATRFIRLMLIDNVKPETIVALTFSRAAAQEIYTKILERLCRAASEGIGRSGKTFAESEWENLLDDFRKGLVRDADAKLAAILANPPPHERADFARLLRQLVDTQHLGAIATLDSFILKIVRNFPKEMGIENAVSVLDPIAENAAVGDAVRMALSKTGDSSGGIGDAFMAAQKGEFTRQCLSAVGTILVRQGWRNFVLSHPDCTDLKHGGRNRWTVRSMAANLGVDLESVCPDLSMIPFNDVHRKGCVSYEESFVEWARSYDGTKSPVDTKGGVVDLMMHFWENPEATSYDYTFYKKPFTVDCGAEGAAAIRGAIRHMENVYLRRQLEIVEAKIRLVEAVEREYERMTRRMGKLTFADFTAYSAEEEFSKRGIALKNVEFRFDSKFDHWALDEFQDTSELQWRCLRELVRNAAEEGHEGGERTAMAVGDMKQSIYTWRGASARPFEDIATWTAFDGFERDFSASHRYGPNIADFVNKVFGGENIQLGGVIPDACADAVSSWRAGWRDHVSNEAPDHVKVVTAPKGADDGEEEGMLTILAAEVNALWQRHRAVGSADTVGILVRGNSDGLRVAEYLRRHGLDVVWEGLNPCSDDPVVQAVLAHLKLADHPSDTSAWKTVSELIDIRSVLLPECASLAAASAAVALAMTQQGLARTLKDWSGRLLECGRIDSGALTAEKLRELVELAVAFEARPIGEGGALDFIEFVAGSGRREISSSSEVVRILTIHRSKGLGIDHVFVPLFEGDRPRSAIDAPNVRSPLFAGEPWVLSHLAKGSERLNAKTKAAYDRMRSERFAESLRTYYVALTRAKKSMVVVVPDDGDKGNVSNGLLMRDLVRNAVGALPYESGTPPAMEPKEGQAAPAGRAAWTHTGDRVRIERVTPSHGAFHSTRGGGVSDLFDADFGDAAQKGIEAHAAYAAIEWIDPDAERLADSTDGNTPSLAVDPRDALVKRILAGDFRAAFVRPSADATVWRERSYELLVGKRWESGQFDRVVFTGKGANRFATIYDFKTNSRHRDESDEAFAGRMRTLYSHQMEAYRQALGRLTGLSPDRIAAVLLLEDVGRAVRIGGAL